MYTTLNTFDLFSESSDGTIVLVISIIWIILIVIYVLSFTFSINYIMGINSNISLFICIIKRRGYDQHV